MAGPLDPVARQQGAIRRTEGVGEWENRRGLRACADRERLLHE
jgi:hypothetical protein